MQSPSLISDLCNTVAGMVTTGGGGEHVNRGRDTPSFCGSVWYMVRNLRCTVTIDSFLANSKTQKAVLSPVHAVFRRDSPLTVKPASTSRRLLLPPPKKKTWKDSLPIDMLLSAVSVVVVARPSSEFLERFLNYCVYAECGR
jgi:hypothetical protein